MVVIYKIIPRDMWEVAKTQGVLNGSADDIRDGYIHFSTKEQLAATAAKFFSGQDDLVLLDVESEKLGSALRYEPSRNNDLFPHLYNVLSSDCVNRARHFSVSQKGEMHIGAQYEEGVIHGSV